MKETPEESCCTPVDQIKRYVDCKGCDRKPKQETLEDFCTRELSNFNDNVRNTQFDLGFRTGAIIGLRFPKERSYSEEEARSSLTDLSLVNPAHLTMTSDGYGEFPDSYKLTEKGINYIIEQLTK